MSLPWPPQINTSLKYDVHMRVIEVASLIKESLKSKTPLSIIRLGDGEAAVVGYPEFTPTNEFERNLRVFFGKNTLNKQQQLAFIQQVKTAISHADIIGVHSGDVVTRSNVIRYFMDVYNLVSLNTKITGSSLHRNLQELNLYKSFLNNLDEIGVITCRDVTENTKKTFYIKNVIVYNVPEEVKFAKDKNSVSRHYPERFEELRNTLIVPKAGTLFLVGAGPLGKVYCQWIKEKGGIALDIGSVFDAWAGLNTRKYMEDSEGNFDNKYALLPSR
jgi:hypothetical protein